MCYCWKREFKMWMCARNIITRHRTLEWRLLTLKTIGTFTSSRVIAVVHTHSFFALIRMTIRDRSCLRFHRYLNLLADGGGVVDSNFCYSFRSFVSHTAHTVQSFYNGSSIWVFCVLFVQCFAHICAWIDMNALLCRSHPVARRQKYL